MKPARNRFVTLYDFSTVFLIALALLGIWLYGGPPEEDRRRQEQFVSGVDNVLGGMGTPQLVLEYGGIDEDPAINERVSALFQQVAVWAREDRGDLRYNISVLKSEVPNAFSLPGGRNFITRGLVELLDDDDEIAGVLGHELAHTVKSHGSKSFGRDLGMILLYDFLLDKVDASQRRNAAELAELSYALVSTGYSRAAETEADRVGLHYAAQAGFDPLGLARALEKIEAYQREQRRNRPVRTPETPEFFRTHPLTEDRIRNIYAWAKELGYDVVVPGDAVTEAVRRHLQEERPEVPGL